jgi:hypothetical protein
MNPSLHNKPFLILTAIAHLFLTWSPETGPEIG